MLDGMGKIWQNTSDKLINIILEYVFVVMTIHAKGQLYDCSSGICKQLYINCLWLKR